MLIRHFISATVDRSQTQNLYIPLRLMKPTMMPLNTIVAAILLLVATMDVARAESAPWVKRVEFVSSPQYESTYRLGEQISVGVGFRTGSRSSPRSVTLAVTGTPQLGLTIGAQTRQARYDAARSATAHRIRGLAPMSVLVFTYTIQATDLDTDGISIAANALTLNSGTISLAWDATTTATLSHSTVATDATRKVDGRLRRPPDLGPLRNTPSPLCGGSDSEPYGLGEEMLFEVRATPSVTVTGTPQVKLLLGEGSRKDWSYWGNWDYFSYPGNRDSADWELGSPPSDAQVERMTRYADYDAARSTPDRLIFAYTVQAADQDDDGVVALGTPLRLNGGSIVEQGHPTNHADPNDLAVGNLQLSDYCKVDGGGGGGTNPGGGSTNPGGNNPGTSPWVKRVEFVSSPQYESTYRLGEQISVGVGFRTGSRSSPRSVTLAVTGTPQLGLTIGAQTRQARYDAARSATAHRIRGLAPMSVLVFTYTIQATDLDTDGISIAANALTLNSGTISLAWDATTTATLSHSTVATDATRKVDGRLRRPPDLGPLRNTPSPLCGGSDSEPYGLGEEMLFEVRATPSVTVTGTPQVKLLLGEGSRKDWSYWGNWDYFSYPGNRDSADWELGSPPSDAQVERMTRYADYDAARSTPDRLIFAYTVQAADQDDDGVVALGTPLRLNGGSIVEQGHPTNHADPNDLAVGNLQLSDYCKVDGGGGGGTNPGGGSNPEPSLRVSAVRLTGTPVSGTTYRLGERIQVAVTFTDAVTVTGTPQIGLSIGSQTRQAVYDAAQSKGTLVMFSYYVQATDADADGISIAANALTLNGGTLTLASDTTTAAALDHGGVGTDDTRKVDGSTDVVEHGDSREQATLLVLSARTTGEVGETGQESDVQVGVATARSAEVAGALEQTGDADYFRVEVPGAGRLTVETTGATDTVGALLGATGQELTEDDDGGTESNFRLERQVQAGTYYVAVTGGESEQVVGLYTLAMRFTPARGGTPVGNVAPPPRGSTPPAGSSPPARGATGDREDRQPTALRLNTKTTGRLDRAGEVDRFRVEIQEAGTVTVEASGAAAPIAYFGAGDEPALPARAGVRAVQAAWPVTAGTYHVAVVGGPGRTRTGAYTVAVRFTAASEAGPLRATLLNVAPAHAWVHFYCGRAQHSEAAACTAQVQCGQLDGAPVAWDVTVPAETLRSYWPGRRAADGTSADFAAALGAVGTTEEVARQRTTCRVFSPDPLEVRAYTQVAGELVPVAHRPAPVDATAPTRVATLLNLAPAHARVHLACRKTQTADGEPVDPCAVRLQCGQQDGTPVSWDVDVVAETTLTYGPGGTSDDLATALVAAGKTETEARRRTTCQVFSRDPLDAWAYTRVGGDLVSVTNPPAAVDAGAPTRVATLLNVAPAHAWVHFYCRKAHDPDGGTVDPCNVRLQCGQQEGPPVAWDVNVAPETIFTYWPDKTAEDGTPADFAAALIGAGKTEAEARRRTTCQVFSTDPVEVRGYTQVGGAVVPVANPPVVPAADAPTRIGTLLNVAPTQAWVHFYCRKAHQPDAETVDPCTVRLQCGQQDGASVRWDVEVAPETIFSYWPGRTTADGTSDNLAAALVTAGKTEAEARRRTTCQVFSTDPVDVRGYTQLDETVIPVKN